MTEVTRIPKLPTKRPHELDAEDRVPRWLVEALWARSAVGVIGGTPKSLKTWLGLELAVAVSTGTPCLDRYPGRESGPALVYLAEDALGSVRERLAALAAARRRPLDALDLHIITVPALRLDQEDDLRRLAATVRDIRPRLLLLDPLVRLHTCDENDASAVSAILGRLRVLQRHYDTAVALVHHTRKQTGPRQHGQALRGSGDLHAWGDSNLYLTHETEGVVLTVEHRAQKAQEPVGIELVGDPPRLVVRDVALQATSPLEEHVVERSRLERSVTRRHAARTTDRASQ